VSFTLALRQISLATFAIDDDIDANLLRRQSNIAFEALSL
jgi:hypothetical protein